jgi:muramoyltetrapeptide carboxypeptidase
VTLPLIKPPALRRGDTIGLISPGKLATFPRRIERGISELQRLGFEVRTARHALQQEQTDEERAADIHELVADASVRAIMLTLAGDAATIGRVIDLLDYDLIRRHPKIIVAQSAATTLLLAVYQRAGLVTFHGPCLVQHFGGVEGADVWTVTNFLDVLQGKAVDYPAAARHSDEYQDWDFEDQPRRWQESPSWRGLKGGRASGRLLGGSLRGLLRNFESPYAADLHGALLFWDLPFRPDEPPDPKEARQALAALGSSGAFADMAAMIAGKPYLYDTVAGLPSFDSIILEAFAGVSKPVLAGVDSGHTLPMLTLPVGGLAELDAGTGQIRLLEPAVG